MVFFRAFKNLFNFKRTFLFHLNSKSQSKMINHLNPKILYKEVFIEEKKILLRQSLFDPGNKLNHQSSLFAIEE